MVQAHLRSPLVTDEKPVLLSVCQ